MLLLKEHLACYSSGKEKINKEITSIINTKAIEKNHYYFSTFIDVADFLATNQLVFRGKINAFESEDGEEKDSF